MSQYSKQIGWIEEKKSEFLDHFNYYIQYNPMLLLMPFFAHKTQDKIAF